MSRTTPAAVFVQPLAVQHAAGADPATLACAVVDGHRIAQPEVLGEAPQEPIPVFSDPAREGDGYAARMERLLGDSAARLRERLATAEPAAAVLLPPGPHRPGACWARRDRLVGELVERVPALRRVRWWRPQGAMAPLQLLHRAVQAVVERRLTSILIGGLDACAAPAACADPRVRRQCLPAVDGPAAADGAAFLLLHGDRGGGAADVRLRRFALGGPPEQPGAWQRVLQTVVPEAEEGGDRAELHGFGRTPAERHAWANARRLVPALRREPLAARHLVWRALGFAGAATLPLQLVAAAGLLRVASGPQRVLLTAVGGGVAGALELRQPGEGGGEAGGSRGEASA
ncbi:MULTISPECIES: hypothetical protein [unclassified Halorhodospira]|uniref:hypothetical protein n=1 Tax=unclassified Halorhodospira TaxID=2626748 RepID=UPI001EE7F9EB|nr:MULTISPECIES: hypothetical protein [unclassified Halorhodospira]MCG5540747.1 hypothetical protein [Halorhodospira sp. M39old]MCG5545926.1 hypothetical protein [Halorhodospira sp. M38]